MSQSSYFKSRSDLLTLGGAGGGNLWENTWICTTASVVTAPLTSFV